MGAYQVLRNPVTRKRYLETKQQQQEATHDAQPRNQSTGAGAVHDAYVLRCHRLAQQASTSVIAPLHRVTKHRNMVSLRFQGEAMQLRWGLQGVFDGMHLDGPDDSSQRAPSWRRAWSVTKHEIHAALRTAYFGPPLQGGLVGALPPCFEVHFVGTLFVGLCFRKLQWMLRVELNPLPRVRSARCLEPQRCCSSCTGGCCSALCRCMKTPSSPVRAAPHTPCASSASPFIALYSTTQHNRAALHRRRCRCFCARIRPRLGQHARVDQPSRRALVQPKAVAMCGPRSRG